MKPFSIDSASTLPPHRSSWFSCSYQASPTHQMTSARRTWLRTYAERTGTVFLDLTDAILDENPESPFIHNDWHLNPRGHFIVANQLERLLSETVLGSGGSHGTTRS